MERVRDVSLDRLWVCWWSAVRDRQNIYMHPWEGEPCLNLDSEKRTSDVSIQKKGHLGNVVCWCAHDQKSNAPSEIPTLTRSFTTPWCAEIMAPARTRLGLFSSVYWWLVQIRQSVRLHTSRVPWLESYWKLHLLSKLCIAFKNSTTMYVAECTAKVELIYFF